MTITPSSPASLLSVWGTILLTAALLAAPARAQAPSGEPALPAAPELDQASPGSPPVDSAPMDGPFWDRANLFGDPGGVRGRLAARGLTLSLTEISEVLGNPVGGRRRTVVYDGLTLASVSVNTEKAFGLPGGTFLASGLQIHGRGLSQNALGDNLNVVSSVEAGRGTLLFELWYEQEVLDGKLAVRAGQLAADQEFIVSQYAALFTNSTFGWPTYTGANLPSGGPNYPLAALGARVRLRPAEGWTVLAAAFNGDPAGPGAGTLQERDPSGTAFRLRDGVFAIAEVQYALGGDGAAGLPGSYKLGGWYNSQRFADQRVGSDQLSLADPLGGGVAITRRGDWSLYAVADQLVWREPGTRDQGVGVFARAMGGPGDRNLLNLYLDAGVTWKGLVPGRVNDTPGLGIGYARFSDTAAKLDSDRARLAGAPRRIRRNETVIELTYQAEIAPWWQVQPSAQYVVNLNGGSSDPARPGRRLRNAVVLGLRTGISF